MKQRIFIGALLLLAFVLSVLVVRFLDPSKADGSSYYQAHCSAYQAHCSAETAACL
jgi:hypothetical protein